MVSLLEVTMHVLTMLLTIAVIVGFMWCALCVPFRVTLLLLLTLCLAFTLPWIAVFFAITSILWLKNGEEIRYRYYFKHKNEKAKAA
jgi:hypothetical protein